MQKRKLAKTALAAIVVVTALVTLQMISAQPAAAQTVNQGQCQKLAQDVGGLPKEVAKEQCKEVLLGNQGECFKLVREFGASSPFTEEDCREMFAPNPRIG